MASFLSFVKRTHGASLFHLLHHHVRESRYPCIRLWCELQRFCAIPKERSHREQLGIDALNQSEQVQPFGQFAIRQARQLLAQFCYTHVPPFASVLAFSSILKCSWMTTTSTSGGRLPGTKPASRLRKRSCMALICSKTDSHMTSSRSVISSSRFVMSSLSIVRPFQDAPLPGIFVIPQLGHRDSFRLEPIAPRFQPLKPPIPE